MAFWRSNACLCKVSSRVGVDTFSGRGVLTAWVVDDTGVVLTKEAAKQMSNTWINILNLAKTKYESKQKIQNTSGMEMTKTNELILKKKYMIFIKRHVGLSKTFTLILCKQFKTSSKTHSLKFRKLPRNFHHSELFTKFWTWKQCLAFQFFKDSFVFGPFAIKSLSYNFTKWSENVSKNNCFVFSTYLLSHSHIIPI